MKKTKTKTKTVFLMTAALAVLFLFGLAGLMESSAWARAGGGGSMGSRGSRSFSAPTAPSSPSRSAPSPGSSPSSPTPGYSGPSSMPGQPSSGMFGRSSFMQGMAGGLAGGFLGSLLFGGRSHASPMGTSGGGGIGLMDIIILGLLIYFGLKFYRKWSAPRTATGYDEGYGPPRVEGPNGAGDTGYHAYQGSETPGYTHSFDEVTRGLQQIQRADPSFNEERFKETAQDIFFRIQAGWMNRSLGTIGNLLSPEMAKFFMAELDSMKEKGRVNKLENIAVRRVEVSEVWQEPGKDFITVLFTANLLDYTLDDKTGQVVEGDPLNPVKFQEYWTFCRDTGSSEWLLSAINQMA